jgi:purine nucleoside phosphorylase
VAVGVITGSGTYALPGFEQNEPRAVETPYGETTVTPGRFGGASVLHISRHGAGHARTSNVVNHRGNIWALKHLGATAVIGCTACGAVDPELELGSLVIFDDLHFIANRLPDGSLCTFHEVAGDPDRGHWILHGGPFSEDIRVALSAAASAAGHAFRDGGVYGHVDGPRFNTPAEIAQLAACGVVAVSQTAGPETVLCGELELPFALIGFVTDYANGVAPGEPSVMATLAELMGRSPRVFADVLEVAVPRIAAELPVAAGTMFRLEESVLRGADDRGADE